MPYRRNYTNRVYNRRNRLANAIYSYPVVYDSYPAVYDPYAYNPYLYPNVLYGGYPSYPWVPTMFTNVVPSWDGVPLNDLI
jgi:hypothetical protein